MPTRGPKSFCVGSVPWRPCGTDAAASRDINDHRAAKHFVRHRVVLVTQTGVQCEIRRDFVFVLAIPM